MFERIKRAWNWCFGDKRSKPDSLKLRQLSKQAWLEALENKSNDEVFTPEQEKHLKKLSDNIKLLIDEAANGQVRNFNDALIYDSQFRKDFEKLKKQVEKIDDEKYGKYLIKYDKTAKQFFYESSRNAQRYLTKDEIFPDFKELKKEVEDKSKYGYGLVYNLLPILSLNKRIMELEKFKTDATYCIGSLAKILKKQKKRIEELEEQSINNRVELAACSYFGQYCQHKHWFCLDYRGSKACKKASQGQQEKQEPECEHFGEYIEHKTVSGHLVCKHKNEKPESLKCDNPEACKAETEKRIRDVAPKPESVCCELCGRTVSKLNKYKNKYYCYECLKELAEEKIEENKKITDVIDKKPCKMTTVNYGEYKICEKNLSNHNKQCYIYCKRISEAETDLGKILVCDEILEELKEK